MLTQLEPVAATVKLLPSWEQDPVVFVRDNLLRDPEGQPVVLDAPQAAILRALAQHDRVVVRSCHGIGKTAVAAIATLWWLTTHNPAKVITLAGSWGHLEDKLWPEIHQWFRGFAWAHEFEAQRLTLYGRANRAGWYAKASNSDRSELIEGWHSPNLLVLIDEAKALSDESYAAIRGALTQVSRTGAKPKLAVLSTPPLVAAGWYVDLFGPRSEGWHHIHVSAHESGRVSQDYIDEMRRDFGEESAVYQSKVLGEIPDAGSNAVIQQRWLEAAQARPEREDRRRSVITCDVARFGEDLTTIGQVHRGKARIVEWRASNDLMTVAGMCLRWVRETGAAKLVVDDTGVGGGVTDRLAELRREGEFPETCQLIPVNFAASAWRHDRFHSIKDELWWTLRDAIRPDTDEPLALQSDHEIAALQLPRGSHLRTQLSAPWYEEDSRARVWVHDHRGPADKRERMKSLPSKSPDLAHAIILGVREYLRLQPEDELPRDAVEAHEQALHQAIRERLKQREQESLLMQDRDYRAQTGGLPGLGR